MKFVHILPPKDFKKRIYLLICCLCCMFRITTLLYDQPWIHFLETRLKKKKVLTRDLTGCSPVHSSTFGKKYFFPSDSWQFSRSQTAVVLQTQRVDLMPKSPIQVSSDHRSLTHLISEFLGFSPANFRVAWICVDLAGAGGVLFFAVVFVTLSLFLDFFFLAASKL